MLPWYSPWLKVSLALRMALTYPWDANAWAEVRQHVPWLLAEQSRIQRAAWFKLMADHAMERRTFMALVSSGLLAAPLAAEAQQPGKEARIGVLWPGMSP